MTQTARPEVSGGVRMRVFSTVLYTVYGTGDHDGGNFGSSGFDSPGAS